MCEWVIGRKKKLHRHFCWFDASIWALGYTCKLHEEKIHHHLRTSVNTMTICVTCWTTNIWREVIVLYIKQKKTAGLSLDYVLNKSMVIKTVSNVMCTLSLFFTYKVWIQQHTLSEKCRANKRDIEKRGRQETNINKTWYANTPLSFKRWKHIIEHLNENAFNDFQINEERFE